MLFPSCRTLLLGAGLLTIAAPTARAQMLLLAGNGTGRPTYSSKGVELLQTVSKQAYKAANY